jgi:hypothetical protein
MNAIFSGQMQQSGRKIISSSAQRTDELVPLLQVFPDVQYDPEIVALYKEEAEAHGMCFLVLKPV